MPDVAIVVGTDGLDQIVQALRADGRTVIGPLVRNGVITHDEIQSARELPEGWTEEQEGGTYRLEQTGTDELFGWATPSTSWKQYLYPPRTLLIRAHKSNGTVDVEHPERCEVTRPDAEEGHGGRLVDGLRPAVP